jgi:uncharacterized membrane protein
MQLTAIMLLGYCALWMGVLSFTRGTWYDEFWTIWFSDSSLSLRSIMLDRWSTDVHPPLYYFYAWLTDPLTQDSLPVKRVTNVVVLLLAALSVRVGRKYQVDPVFSWTFIVLVASSPFFIVYFAEFRSYFFQLVNSACAVFLLHILHMQERRLSIAGDGPLMVMLVVVILIGANLNFAATIIIFAVVGAECLSQLIRGRRWEAGFLAGCVMFAALPLSISVALMLARHSPMTAYDTSTAEGLLTIFAMFALSIPNLVLAGLLLSKIRENWRCKGHWRASFAALRAPNAYTYCAVSGLALCVISIAFGLLNARTHFLVPRYIIAVIPVVIAPITYLVREQLAFRDGLFGLLCLNGGVTGTIGAFTEVGNKRWETYAPAFRQAFAACPGTRVIGLDSTMLSAAAARFWGQVHDSAEVTRMSYVEVGRRYGFPVEYRAKAKLSTVSQNGCPTIIWVEKHFGAEKLKGPEIAVAAGVLLEPAQIESTHLVTEFSRLAYYIIPKQNGQSPRAKEQERSGIR